MMHKNHESYGFVGTWEIVQSHLVGSREKLGLNGIKFRLDEMGDIIWYNDLINTTNRQNGSRESQSNGFDGAKFCPINDSAAVLFSCETFEIVELSSNGPGLIFGAYTGHSIEFRSNHYNPGEQMSLWCECWCELHCKRVKVHQSVSQDEPFTLLSVLNDDNFCDVTLKSCDNVIFNVHSPILRLNGFDCSVLTASSTYRHMDNQFECTQASPQEVSTHPPLMKASSVPCTQKSCSAEQSIGGSSCPGSSTVICSITEGATSHIRHSNMHVSPVLSSQFLLPPSPLDSYNLSPNQETNISNSCNCLMSVRKGCDKRNNSISLEAPKRQAYQTSSCSDTNLHIDRNVFYFPETQNACRIKCKLVPSPFRVRNPSPFPTLDTPPPSPLTPLSVLNNIPAKILSTILHWLYSESLPEQLDEDTCVQLIHVCESTTPLSRMSQLCKNYLRNIQLKKVVVDIICDLHDSLNNMIHMVNPGTISHSPCTLCQVFKEGIKECLTAIVKLLQFCNIFTKDATTFTRQQRHEIIKYVRTRMPIYLSQVHQLLHNINLVLTSLTPEDHNDLVSYLVPEVTSALELLTSSISKIKMCLERVCKDLKYDQKQQQQQSLNKQQKHYQQQLNHHSVHENIMQSQRYSPNSGRSSCTHSRQSTQLLDNGSTERTCPKRESTRTTTDHVNFDPSTSESDLNFFLYMYEVKKMHDIYGRVTNVLEILLHKKSAFDEMNLLHQIQTVKRNLEQLLVEVPAAIGQLEEICDMIDKKIGWKEFKFCFKFLISQVNGIVSKLLEHKTVLTDATIYISNLVQNEQFTFALVELGMLDKHSVEPALLREFTQRRSGIRSNRQRQDEYSSVKVNLVQNLCVSPTAAYSSLSKNALKLLQSEKLADMEFEVMVAENIDLHHENSKQTFSSSQVVKLFSNSGRKDTGVAISVPDLKIIYEGPNDNGITSRAATSTDVINVSSNTRGSTTMQGPVSHFFKAHRVIVAARCDWFKKALLSGMQEDINRKIVIYDTSPVIFRRLLLYLYGAPVDKSVGVDHLCELMLLADRYSVDNLKAICEQTLVNSIDSESVICLYGISDRFNAATLKARCLSYLSQHTEQTQLDIFQELPGHLQKEVHELICWCGRAPDPWCDHSERTSFDRDSRHNMKS